MNNLYKNSIGLLLLVLGAEIANSSTLNARTIRVHPLDFTFFDDIFENMQAHMRQLHEQFASFGPNKEERQALKAARESLVAIKPEITQDDQSVIVTFSGLENIDKQAIDIEYKDYNQFRWGRVKAHTILRGTIPASQGTVSFVIGSHGIEITRQIEIKKEEASQQKDQADKQQAVAYVSSLKTEYIEFPQPVSISKDTVKAETKNNSLVITLAKKQEIKNTQKEQSKLVINHN